MTFFIGYSQKDKNLTDLKNKKNQFLTEIENLKDSISILDIKIAKLESGRFLKKIKDSTFIVIAKKGAKLKKDSDLFADVIVTFSEDKEVIILDYQNGYFEICQNSLCGYINEVWLENSSELKRFINSKNSLSKANQEKYINLPNYSSSLSNSKTSKSIKRSKTYRTYIRGPKGGCYYINSNGNKTYVSRSLCN